MVKRVVEDLCLSCTQWRKVTACSMQNKSLLVLCRTAAINATWQVAHLWIRDNQCTLWWWLGKVKLDRIYYGIHWLKQETHLEYRNCLKQSTTSRKFALFSLKTWQKGLKPAKSKPNNWQQFGISSMRNLWDFEVLLNTLLSGVANSSRGITESEACGRKQCFSRGITLFQTKMFSKKL